MNPLAPAFFGGFFCMGFAVIGLIFLRYWHRTRDGLFLAFAASFWLLAAGQGVSAFRGLGHEYQGGAYLLRLAAFALILIAIVRKNLSRR
jgi:hypothetical protein